MFPLSVTQYVKMGLCVLVLVFSWYLGFSFEHSRFLAYKADQVAQTQKLEKTYQEAANRIESNKNAQIRSINNQLVDAIDQLRKRPGRTTETSAGQGGTGASLFAEDAIFLRREAARADEIRVGLEACYKQYDTVGK